jgi:hypothetical protein
MAIGLPALQVVAKPWIAIIDHSIDIGTKKALVVLLVEVDALSKRGSAIRQLENTWNTTIRNNGIQCQ